MGAVLSGRGESPRSERQRQTIDGEVKVRRLMSTEECAEYLNISPRTLEGLRLDQCRPPFIKLGLGKQSPVRYRCDAVEKWLVE